MKRFMLLFGIVLILPWHALSQGPEFLPNKEFQAEKKKLQESINRIHRANQELQQEILFQAAAVDSLATLLDKQAIRITAQRDSLNLLQNGQANLDGRLLTQRKSGTLIAIIVPVVLFLFTLLVLLWFVTFRRRAQSLLHRFEDQLKEQTGRLEEQQAAHTREHDSLLQELRANSNGMVKQIQGLTTRLDEGMQEVNHAIQLEKATHDARHLESHQEFEKVKEGLQKGVNGLEKELAALKEVLASRMNQVDERIRELVKPKKG